MRIYYSLFKTLVLACFVFTGCSILSAGEFDNPNEIALRTALKNRGADFERMIEDKIIPKIAEDIGYILEQKWADAVSTKDLYHVHVNIITDYPEDKTGAYPNIFNGSDFVLLYHSHEYDGKADDPYRNIISTLKTKPHVIPGEVKEYTNTFGKLIRYRTVSCGELKSWYAADIRFGLSVKDMSAYITEFRKTFRYGIYYFGLNTNF